MGRPRDNSLDLADRNRRRAALATCEVLLAPGKKWRVSPYLVAAIRAAGDPSLRRLVPIYQSVFLDLLRDDLLPAELTVTTLGDVSGIGLLAFVDGLLAWQTACAFYGIPSGLPQVQLPPAHRATEYAAREAFASALSARSAQIPGLYELTSAAKWFTQQAAKGRPDLAIVAFPWDHTGDVQCLLAELPDDGILAAVAWPRATGETRELTLMSWRYRWLTQFPHLFNAGPCGQEFGGCLPQACENCSAGRRELMHAAGSGEEDAVSWSYVLLSKRPCAEEAQAGLAVADLDTQFLGVARARYMGTVRQRVVVAEHPDRRNDNPSDTQWREYLRVCPGRTAASALAVERTASALTPRLRYGQWLNLSGAQVLRPFTADLSRCVLQVRDEAILAGEQLAPDPTFLGEYSPSVRAAVDEAGYRLFGFPALRPFQHTILARALCGRSGFSIAATGSGKSECYILPAMLLPGVTVVVSPLKSLMTDQFEQRIRDRYGLDHLTTYLNGDVSFYERQGRLRRIVQGYYKLVYVTPEQLERGYVLDALRQANETVGVRYLALDEAHCISQWGHDFRPSYLNIVGRIEEHGLHPCRIALTATASPLVRQDVCAELRLDPRELAAGGDVFIEAANRPELNLVVRRVIHTKEKARLIVDALRGLPSGSAIVFMPHTGGRPEKPADFGAPMRDAGPENAGMVSPGVSPFARYLSAQLDQPVALYHGAMDAGGEATEDGRTDEERADAPAVSRVDEQRDFMADRKRVMVATKGFGMGVDKPDIRLVVHRSPPGNLEAYAQEAGRAGRDGQPATALLLYSDDRPEIRPISDQFYLTRQRLPSDRDIQQYFLDNRFVRREDVQAMIAFLKGDGPRRVNGRLYFTNDQAMVFLDGPVARGPRLRYAWPAFPPRPPAARYESDDHRQIRDLGHLYAEKRKHIGRILAVLYNNRPTAGGTVLPLVDSSSETGTLLSRFRIYQPERIIASPVYFGERLRAARINEGELQRLLPGGERTSIEPLALRLGLSLRETLAMLQDIRSCEGRYTDNGGRRKWTGTLLNFEWVEAPRLTPCADPYDLSTWRAYAGAFKRVPPRGEGRTLDDYFPWSTLNMPVGWEVAPGAGLAFNDADAYLEAFMALHDQRRKNDQSNFVYLVDKYIGAAGRPPECLRSLLLGYLKTNEVVFGGNCYSCSVCVPDLDFDKHPLEQRRSVIVRLMGETSELMAGLEAANRRAPEPALVERLLGAIRAENEAGRSGTAYLESWLARLLQDDPGHQGALWMRIAGHLAGAFALTAADLLSAFERLHAAGGDAAEKARLWQAARHVLDERNSVARTPAFRARCAEIAETCGDWQPAAQLWREILNSAERGAGTSRQALQLRALRSLFRVHGPGGPLPDAERACDIGLQLARGFEVPLTEAQAAYRLAVPRWSWEMLVTELEGLSRSAPAALLTWLELHPNREAPLAWLEAHGERVRTWPEEVLYALELQLAVDLDRSPTLLLALCDASLDQSEGGLQAARFALRALAANAGLDERQLGALARNLASLDDHSCRTVIAGSKQSSRLLALTADAHKGEGLPAGIVARFPPTVVLEASDPVFDKILSGLTQNARQAPDLWQGVLRRIGKTVQSGRLEILAASAQTDPGLARSAFEFWLGGDILTQALVAPLLSVFLKDKSDMVATGRLLDEMGKRPGWADGGTSVAACVDNWIALRGHASVFSLLSRAEITGGELKDLGKRWLADRSRIHRADMLVVILRRIRARSSPNWLTPVSWEVEALCAARRFSEAEVIVRRYRYLTIAGKEADRYVADAARQSKPRQCEEEQLYERLLDLAAVSKQG